MLPPRCARREPARRRTTRPRHASSRGRSSRNRARRTGPTSTRRVGGVDVASVEAGRSHAPTLVESRTGGRVCVGRRRSLGTPPSPPHPLPRHGSGLLSDRCSRRVSAVVILCIEGREAAHEASHIHPSTIGAASRMRNPEVLLLAPEPAVTSSMPWPAMTSSAVGAATTRSGHRWRGRRLALRREGQRPPRVRGRRLRQRLRLRSAGLRRLLHRRGRHDPPDVSRSWWSPRGAELSEARDVESPGGTRSAGRLQGLGGVLIPPALTKLVRLGEARRRPIAERSPSNRRPPPEARRSAADRRPA